MRALIQEMTYVDSAISAWNKAIQARRTFLVTAQSKVAQHRETVELEARNKTVQVFLTHIILGYLIGKAKGI